MLIPIKQDSINLREKRNLLSTLLLITSGHFSLNNLHEGDYRIYALKETSPNKIYDKDDELIAFLKKPIHLRRDTAAVQLKLFKQVPEKYRSLSPTL